MHIRTYHTGVFICLLLGVALRLRFFLSERSLWLDEAKVANNLLSRDFLGLTEPLSSGQYAPIGWLWIEKAILLLLGNSEYVLRLGPFIAGTLAIILFFYIARRWFERFESLIVLAIFCGANFLIQYSAELKQYSTDLLCSLIAILLVTRTLKDHSAPTRWALVLAGLLLPWFSQPVILVLGGVAAALIFHEVSAKQWRNSVGWTLIGLAWLTSALTNLIVNFAHVFDRSSVWLFDYWSFGFWNLPPDEFLDLLQPIKLLNDFVAFQVGLLFLAPLGTLLLVAGTISAWRQKRALFWIAAFPILATLIAAGLHKYPFHSRLILFLVPSALLLLASGLEALGKVRITWKRECLRPLIRTYAPLFLLLPIAGQVALGMAFPKMFAMVEDIGPVLSQVSANARPNDRIIVGSLARPAWEYYHKKVGLDENRALVISRKGKQGPVRLFSDFLRELNDKGDLTGRWWIVLAHYKTANQRPATPPHEFIIDRIRGIGAPPDLYTNILMRRGQQLESYSAMRAWAGLYAF